MNANDVSTFEQARPALLGVASRILESRADAEDAVQDCFLRWRACDRASVVSPAAWLITVCTRRCLDLLRAADRARVDYQGASLPESLEPVAPGAPEADFSASLDEAFLLMLERLTPKERAAWLLHDILDHPFAQIANALGMKEGACQKLVERARGRIEDDRRRRCSSPQVHARLLGAFRSTIDTGNPTQLVALLARDIRLNTRGATGLHVVPGAGHAIGTLTANMRGDLREERAARPVAHHRRSRQDRRARQRAA